MADEKIPVTNNFGGTKFIAVMFSMALLGGMFWLTMTEKLLSASVVNDYLWTLALIIMTGVGGNILERFVPILTIIAPLLPDIIAKSWFGRKQ